MSRRLNLATSIVGTGTGPASWNWPGTQWNRWADWEHYKRSAQIAQRGVFDAIFVSDHAAHARGGDRAPGHVFDPIVLFSAIAGAVPDIGFVLTASTSYNSPYNLARRLASLDAISGGRLIFNAVSNFNPDIAANFGVEPLLPREERYRKADEFLRVVKELWLSWDAPVGEAPAGPLWDETTARTIDHHGEFFDVRGPLNVPIGPQGHPVIAQAGASGPGLDFAAKHAEIVYAATLSKELAVRLRDELHARALAQGRAAEGLKLLPGVNIIVGEDEDDARRRHQAFYGASTEEEFVAGFLRAQRGWNGPGLPEEIDIDRPLDPVWFEPQQEQNRPIGFSKAIQDLVELEGLTVRQLARRFGDPGGHRLVLGSPKQIAEQLIDWWSDGVVAGYVAHFPLLHGDLELFVDQVIPILQAEGVYPTSYEESGVTIRDRFGLAHPAV